MIKKGDAYDEASQHYDDVFDDVLNAGILSDTEMLDGIAAIGYNGVELPSYRVLKSPETKMTYRRYLNNSPLKVTCIDAIGDFVNHPCEASKTVQSAIDLAVQLSAPIVLTAGNRLAPGIVPAEGRRKTIVALAHCITHAQEAGVLLAIENFGIEPALQCAAQDCYEVLQGVPGLRFVFDTGNFYFAGEDPVPNVDVFLKRVCHVHLKDWAKSETPTIADVTGSPLGTGLIPNEQILKLLQHESGIRSYSVEVGHSNGDKLEAARADWRAAKQWLSLYS